MRVRALARVAVEHLLLPLAGGALRRQARLRRAAILSYHNVAPDGSEPAGDTSLHLPLRSFLDQVERLTRSHSVVGLDELLEGGATAEDKPLAAITFDDAYRGALELAVPALAERGVPTTIFVVPGLLGARAFWWDALASPDGAGLDPSVRAGVLGSGQGRAQAEASPSEHLRPDQGPADLDMLTRIAQLPGVELAAHTWSHPNLTTLSDEDLEVELDRPRAWLKATFPDHSRPDHFAFPYGIWDRRVAEAARAVGYRHLYRVEGGVAPTGQPEPVALPRINVPADLSGAGFELRVAGLIGSA